MSPKEAKRLNTPALAEGELAQPGTYNVKSLVVRATGISRPPRIAFHGFLGRMMAPDRYAEKRQGERPVISLKSKQNADAAPQDMKSSECFLPNLPQRQIG